MNPLITLAILHSGRSWWQARYSNGRILSEWDTLIVPGLPSGPSSTSRWELVNKDGMVGLRLLCPDRIRVLVGELEAPEGHKFFQLKSGGLMIGTGNGGHYVDAHIIGVVENSEGNCFCRAWDYRQKRLLEFRDNVYNMKYLHIGRLSFEVQQLRV